MSQLISRTIDVVLTMTLINNVRKLDSIAEVKDYRDGKYILDFKYKNSETIL